MQGPIRRVIILYGRATAPSGYTKINNDLNYKAGGEYVYIAYSREMKYGDPITDIQVFAGDSASFPTQIGYDRIDDDLNKGAGGKYIYLCTTKNPAVGRPVTDIRVEQAPNRHVYPPSDWVRVDQDCEEGAGPWYSYVSLRR